MIANKFAFIVPVYNAEKTIQQMLLSVISQSYPNWRLIIRDDMSTDGTVQFIKNFVNGFGLHNRVSLTVNQEKHWEVRNIVEALKEIEDDEIVCRLDGDDWLSDLDTLAILNARYNQLDVDAIWTAHRWGFSNQNISGPLPHDADPYNHPWVSSHFKTFKKHLVSEVKDENFRGQDGEYFKRIGDQALYLPVLHQARGRWHFEPMVAYHYTINMKPETFQTDDAIFQRKEAEYLRGRGFIE
ncbi:MAG: glycosyltransferase family 2 protein [Candidatus Thorarchaeota archaeon]